MKNDYRGLISLTILAFLLNVMLPFFIISPASAALTSAQKPLFGDKILICTSKGFIWIDFEEFASQTDDTSPDKDHNPLEECPLCHLVKSGNKDLHLASGHVYTPYHAQLSSHKQKPEYDFTSFTLFLKAKFVRGPPSFL